MLTGAILAGGRHDRINGELKSTLSISGHNLLAVQINQLQKICDDVVIVTNDPLHFLPLVPKEVRVITDYYKGYGPLGGMHAALSLSANPYVWVTACDMPFISLKAASYMYNIIRKTNCDAVIPVSNNKKHILHALYNKNSVQILTKVLNNHSRDFEVFLKRSMWIEVKEDVFKAKKIDPIFVYDIDTTIDYLTANRMIEARGLFKKGQT